MERILLNGQSYGFSNQVRLQEEERIAFEHLAHTVFGLSFEEWFQKGYWTDQYCPYTLFDQGKAVANVSVNRMPFLYEGEKRLYIQLGTVMTEPGYRKRGLSRYLMQRVLDDWKEECDGIYLFANHTVLDFYPKFGFQQGKESRCVLPVTPQPQRVRKLDIDSEEDRKLLKEKYVLGEPFSRFSLTDNWGLLMFHCSGFAKDCIYYLESEDLVVIAEYQKEELSCYQILGNTSASLEQILNEIARPETKRAVLYFSPTGDYVGIDWQEEDETLFLYQEKENLFPNGQLLFPLLSHA